MKFKQITFDSEIKEDNKNSDSFNITNQSQNKTDNYNQTQNSAKNYTF